MRALKRWIPALAVMLLIFGLSSIHGDVVDRAITPNATYQLNGHFILYFLLFFTVFRATNNYVNSLALCLFYSITDELHQTFVPDRSFQFLDLAVDAGGAGLGALILWKLDWILPKRLKNWLKR